MWGYGLRISEVLNLKKNDLDANQIRINGKGNKIRVIPILHKVSIFIKNLEKECPFQIKEGHYYFRGKKRAKIKSNNYSKINKRFEDKFISS